MTAHGTALQAKLDQIVAALRELTAAAGAGDEESMPALAESVREIAESFDDDLNQICGSCGPVFVTSGTDWTEDDDEDYEDEELPEGVRLSVRMREDFVLVDEAAFLESAATILASDGDEANPDEIEDRPAAALSALVYRIGLHEVLFGGAVAGLDPAGGEIDVLVVDEALQDDPEW